MKKIKVIEANFNLSDDEIKFRNNDDLISALDSINSNEKFIIKSDNGSLLIIPDNLLSKINNGKVILTSFEGEK